MIAFQHGDGEHQTLSKWRFGPPSFSCGRLKKGVYVAKRGPLVSLAGRIKFDDLDGGDAGGNEMFDAELTRPACRRALQQR